MSAKMHFDREAQEYFDSLPKFIQESVMQGNQDICSKEELMQCAKNLMNQNSNPSQHA